MPNSDPRYIPVPVSEADFHRKRRRIILACVTGAVAIAGAGYFAYRHFTDPIKARESYDDAKRLAGIARYSQAILACSRAIQLKPDYADAYYVRAQAYAAQHDLEQAEADYERLTHIEPKASRGHVGLCEVHYENKDYNAAVMDCTRAIQADAADAKPYNLRGSSLRAMGEFAKSLDDLNKAVELAPNVDNLFQRAIVLRALGKFKEAIADFDQAAFLFPGNPEVYRARGEAKRAMGDEDGARADYALGRSIDHR